MQPCNINLSHVLWSCTPRSLVTSVSIANPVHALGTFRSKVMGISMFLGAVVVAPSEGGFAYTDSTSKRIVSSGGGFEFIQWSDSAAVQCLLGQLPTDDLAKICSQWTAGFRFSAWTNQSWFAKMSSVGIMPLCTQPKNVFLAIQYTS